MINRRRWRRSLIVLTTILLPLQVFSWELEGAFGRTGQRESTYRVALNKAWDKRWFESSYGYLTGFWSGAYTYWGSGDYNQTTHSLSISPVLLYKFEHTGRLQPYIEAGVGASLFNHTRVGDKRLGSAFNFEDRLGFGVILDGRHHLGFRVLHYSNLGIKRPNQGIESYSLYYSHQF